MASKKKVTKPLSVRKPVRLHVFVKPKGEYTDPDEDHPGIAVPDRLLRLAAAARTAKVRYRKNAPVLELSGKLKDLLMDLDEDVAGVISAPSLLHLTSPSCWDEEKKTWVPGFCPAANAVFEPPTYDLPDAPSGQWRCFVGLQLAEPADDCPQAPEVAAAEQGPGIPVSLPTLPAGVSLKGFALVFHRTRFTIIDVRPERPLKGFSFTRMFDRGVRVTAPLSPRQQLRLVVRAIGGPIVVKSRVAIVTGLDAETDEQGWTLLPEAIADERLKELADPRKEIEDRRVTLQAVPKPKEAQARLFFLRMDEWTDLRTLGEPPVLPPQVKPTTGGEIVLEALRADTLSDGLASWIRELVESDTEYPLEYGLEFTPKQWIQAMATYLKNVFEYAFDEAFARKLTKTVGGATGLDPAFADAFEQFANGTLGENDGGAPKAPQGFPDSAYYFSFAAFAWLAKSAATTADERTFWEAAWPVLAYTAEIYRQRYTPTATGGEYGEYTYEKSNAALTPAQITPLRKSTMTRDDFRAILKAACSGC